MFVLYPIGTVETPFESFSEAPSQGFLANHEGKISLRSPLDHALDGLSVGQQIDVVWYADGADRSLLRLDEGTKGVFASRSQDRPNPISITRCTITDVEDGEIYVEGVDMITGTPILDIKAAYDGPRQLEANVPDRDTPKSASPVDLD